MEIELSYDNIILYYINKYYLVLRIDKINSTSQTLVLGSTTVE